MAKSLNRFKSYCQSVNFDPEIRRFDGGTKTAQSAAEALNVSVDTIIKSLIFLAGSEPIVVLMSGDKRVSVEKLSKVLGVSSTLVNKADADTARIETGFAVGGIPPFGHLKKLRTFMDVSMASKPLCFLAAGTPDSLFEISAEKLLELSNAEVADLAE